MPAVAKEHEQRAAARTSAAQAFRQVARYRLDYTWDDAGRVHAHLTVTLPGGRMFRFAEQGDPYAIYEMVMQHRPDEFIGFSLKGLWKGIKKGARAVATSKVFKTASTALAMAAPALGPMAPAAMAAAGAMKASSALLAAKTYAANGDMASAATLVSAASAIAKSPVVLQASASMATKLASTMSAPAPAKPAPRMITKDEQERIVQAKLATQKAPVFSSAAFAAAWNSPEQQALDRQAAARQAAAAKPSALVARGQIPAGAKLLKPASKGKSTVPSEQHQVFALLLRPA